MNPDNKYGENKIDQLITETGRSHRDQIATIDKKGKRVWIYPSKPKGNFHKWRLILGYSLFALLFIMPFIKINGNPLLLFNIIERKFSLFGILFWPQDLFIIALSFITLLIFIVLFTAAFGRIFCGWICPQTIFMELVFRKIEFLIEGDASAQRKLHSSPWTADKVFKKTLKHTIFYIISFFIGNIFLSYIIGIEELLKIMREPVSIHIGGFIAMLVFSFIFYGVFARFRENACIYVCPYGRLQSVLIDKNTIVVAYDYKRGEPRTKAVRNSSDSGDCIDCGACVRVCPTGIDIRNGTQLECINCTACIDSCDAIMDRIKKPRKLIKYASLNQIENAGKFKFTGRMVLYSVILTALLFITGFLITGMSSIEMKVQRAKGTIYQKTTDGYISNLYVGQLLNKTKYLIKVDIKSEEKMSRIKYVGFDKLILKPEQILDVTFFVELPAERIEKFSSKYKLHIVDQEGNELESVNITFTGPVMKVK